MGVLDKVDDFLGRKRPLRYILIALLLAGLGHVLESRSALGWVAHGQMLTRTIDTQLHTVQPFAIADKYRAATADRRGLWFCATASEIDRAQRGTMYDALRHNLSPAAIAANTEGALPPGKSACNGWLAMARGAVTSVMATPAVTLAVWADGGWVNRLLLPLTILGIFALLTSVWREAAKTGDTALLQTVGILAVGPLLMGAVFWLALWVLFALIWAFGNVLAGLGWVIATFAGAYKVCAFCIGILKSSDGIAEQHRALITPTPEVDPLPPTGVR